METISRTMFEFSPRWVAGHIWSVAADSTAKDAPGAALSVEYIPLSELYSGLNNYITDLNKWDKYPLNKLHQINRNINGFLSSLLLFQQKTRDIYP